MLVAEAWYSLSLTRAIMKNAASTCLFEICCCYGFIRTTVGKETFGGIKMYIKSVELYLVSFDDWLTLYVYAMYFSLHISHNAFNLIYHPVFGYALNALFWRNHFPFCAKTILFSRINVSLEWMRCSKIMNKNCCLPNTLKSYELMS